MGVGRYNSLSKRAGSHHQNLDRASRCRGELGVTIVWPHLSVPSSKTCVCIEFCQEIWPSVRFESLEPFDYRRCSSKCKEPEVPRSIGSMSQSRDFSASSIIMRCLEQWMEGRVPEFRGFFSLFLSRISNITLSRCVPQNRPTPVDDEKSGNVSCGPVRSRHGSGASMCHGPLRGRRQDGMSP